VDGAVFNNSLDKAKILNDYFTSVFTPISLDTPPPMDVPSWDVPFIPDIVPIQVDANDVAEVLNSLEVHKAAGRDEIPVRFLKETRDLLALSVALIYQASLHQCSLPTNWKKHNILYQFSRREIVPHLVTIGPHP